MSRLREAKKKHNCGQQQLLAVASR